MSSNAPYYSGVPKKTRDNLEWRRGVLRQAARDPNFAAAARKMCAEDILFYINGFCWTFDPRDKDMPNRPFLTYDFQDEGVLEFCDAIDNGYSLAWPKSRAMGASWMGLTVIEWYWHFRRDFMALLGSRNENYVDQTGNAKSLFWKIDHLHKNMPKWLLPSGRELGWDDPNRKLLHLGNADTGSVIDGESTTGEFARGDRRTVIFIDEFGAHELEAGYKVLASIFSATNCVLFNSTPQGAANAFYRVVHETGIKVTKMHWTLHPLYNKGMYSSAKGATGQFELKQLDKHTGPMMTVRKNWDKPKKLDFPASYPFILDGKVRSPWYDNQCNGAVGPREIAQELDIDFLGSDYQYFDPDFIRVLIAEYCVPEFMRGDIVFNEKTLEPDGFEMNPKGKLYLWYNMDGVSGLLDDRKFLEGKRFAIGADVSMGTGASNSVASVLDLDTGRKVAVWRDAWTEAGKFTDTVIAMAKWWNGAKLIWDASGPAGRMFTMRVVANSYTNVYYRTDEEKFRQRISSSPGFFMNPADRSIALRDYREALEKRMFINPSEAGMRETLQFVVTAGGAVEHSQALNSQDPNGSGAAHGDEVCADALLSRMRSIKSDISGGATMKDVPWMSPAWRLREAEKQKVAQSTGADW